MIWKIKEQLVQRITTDTVITSLQIFDCRVIEFPVFYLLCTFLNVRDALVCRVRPTGEPTMTCSTVTRTTPSCIVACPPNKSSRLITLRLYWVHYYLFPAILISVLGPMMHTRWKRSETVIWLPLAYRNTTVNSMLRRYLTCASIWCAYPRKNRSRVKFQEELKTCNCLFVSAFTQVHKGYSFLVICWKFQTSANSLACLLTICFFWSQINVTL